MCLTPTSIPLSISRSEWRNNQLPLVVGYSVTCVLIGRHMTQSNPMDIPRLTQLPSFTYRSSFNHTCSLQYLCRSGITTRSYTAKSFHNTGRRMIRMIEYLFTFSGTKNRRRDDYWTVPTHWSSRSCAQHITRISLYESLLSIIVYGHISSTYKYSGFKNSIQRWIWIFTYTIGSSYHRFHSQVGRCVLMRWHQRSYSNDIQDWTGCHHFLEQTYEHSLDLDSPTVITHQWLKLIKLWWK